MRELYLRVGLVDLLASWPSAALDELLPNFVFFYEPHGPWRHFILFWKSIDYSGCCESPEAER